VPTLNHGDDEFEKMYEQIDEVIKFTKENDNLIIMGDCNAVEGEPQEKGILGVFGLGKKPKI